MLLCTLPQAVMLTQLNLVLAENGVMGKGASIMISAYATGMLVGRLLSGVALDRFPGPIVTTTGLALSAVGLLMIASGLDAPALLFVAVLLIGLAYGSESDAIAYLIVRNFGVRIYSSVFGLIAATVSISATLGAVLLSVMLKLTGTFAPFLTLTGVLVLFGSMLFLLLPRNPDVQDSVPEKELAPAAEPANIPRSAAPEGGPLEDQAEPLILR
jgi:MFS family permease